MAIINAYVDPKIVGTKTQKSMRAMNAQGATVYAVQATAIVGATDNNGSIYRLFKNLQPDSTIQQIYVANTAITAGTSYGLGLYQGGFGLNGIPNTNLLTTVGYFSGVMDMSAAAASLNPKTAKDGMAGLTPTLNIYNNRLFEHAGETIINRLPEMDLCLTATTVGTSGGTIVVQVQLIYD